MAVLRLASSKVIPKAVRAIAYPTILSGSITIVQRESYASHQSSFSTVADAPKRADKELAKLLKSKIKSAKRLLSEIQVPEAPTGFPFEIQDIPGEKTIKLTREFEGEKIVIEVEKAWNPEDKNVISDSCDDSDDEYLSTDSSDGKRSINEPQSLFTVTITKENRKTSMYFSCRANANSIAIRSIDFKGSPIIKDSTLKFSDHDTDDTEDYWKKDFLGIRGIDESLSRFMVDYMIRKFRRDRVLFLNKFRKFVKESK